MEETLPETRAVRLPENFHPSTTNPTIPVCTRIFRILQNRRVQHSELPLDNTTKSSIPASPVLTPLPSVAHLSALAAVFNVVGHRGAPPIAAELTEAALVAAGPAVVAIAENVAAVVLAAVEELGAILGLRPRAYVVGLRIASVPFLHILGEEAAPGPGVEAEEMVHHHAAVAGLHGGCSLGFCNDHNYDRDQENGGRQSREACGGHSLLLSLSRLLLLLALTSFHLIVARVALGRLGGHLK